LAADRQGRVSCFGVVRLSASVFAPQCTAMPCRPPATGARRRQHCSKLRGARGFRVVNVQQAAASEHNGSHPPHRSPHAACPVPEGMASLPRRAFVSGPIDAERDYFAQHYIPSLTAAMDRGDHFVVGPVAGVDTLTLGFLLDPPPPLRPCDPKRISVYMAAFEFADLTRRNHYRELGVNVREVDTAGPGTTTRQRDEMMTQESDYDILRYRSEEEAKRYYGESWWPRVSNTEVNERRRKGITDLSYNLDGSVAPIVKGVEGEREVQKDESRGKMLGRRLQKLFGK
jgi:hypothetical protein